MPGFFPWRKQKHVETKSNINDQNDVKDIPPEPKPKVGRNIAERIEILNKMNKAWEQAHHQPIRVKKFEFTNGRDARMRDLNAPKQRVVRFRDIRGANSSNKSATWSYPAQNKNTPVQQQHQPQQQQQQTAAPLAPTEPEAAEENHAETAVFNGIQWIEDDEDPGIMSEAETSSTGAFRRGASARNTVAVPSSQINKSPRQHLGLVFLQNGDETKRVLLPERLVTLDDVKSLFLSTFPVSLSRNFLDSPHLRIYIQDAGKADLFYELDDLRDIKDRSVLRLREQRPSSPAPNPPPPTPYDTPQPIPPFTTQPPPPPLPTAYLSEDDMNYYSESELDMADYRMRKSGPYYPSAQRGRFSTDINGARSNMLYPMRPASALPPGAAQPRGRYYAPPKPLRPASAGYQRSGSASSSRSRSPPAPPVRMMFRAHDNYSGFPPEEAYASDVSDNVPRSGSVTPVIDEEARARVISMEKELHNLSSLVHSALSSKGVPESVSKDIEMLRREILGPGYRTSSDVDTASDAGSISRFSDLSSEKGSSFQSDRDQFGYGGTVNLEMKHQMHEVKRHVADLQDELKHLRRMAQVNAQSSRDLLRETFDKITLILSSNKQFHDLSPLRSQLEISLTGGQDETSRERALLNQLTDRHKSGLRSVEHKLSDFERDVEGLRQRVINGERRLKMAEVEEFTGKLTGIGRQAATIKTQFPTLHQRLKTVMSIEMEKVVREEKFLKEEPHRMDTALRRCKKLTNTMITMKKLAMVQDSEATPERTIQPPLPQALRTSRSPPNMSYPPPPAPSGPPLPPTPEGYQLINHNSSATSPIHNRPSPPAEQSLSKPAQNKENPHVLDTLLEELQTVAKAPEPKEVDTIMSDSRDSDTMKRRPSPPQTSTPITNGSGAEFHGPVLAQSTPRSRSSLGVPYGRDILELKREKDRSRSNTPTSVCSEPGVKPPIPPLPVRYHTLQSNIRGYTDSDVVDLKHSLGDRRPPTAIERTNALLEPEDNNERWTRSASSSESVNSQDGARSLTLENGPPAKPPPPPPPPRNRQELLEQRQQELIDKQRQLQSQFHKLQELRHNSSNSQQNGGPNYPFAFARR